MNDLKTKFKKRIEKDSEIEIDYESDDLGLVKMIQEQRKVAYQSGAMSVLPHLP